MRSSVRIADAARAAMWLHLTNSRDRFSARDLSDRWSVR